MNTLLLHPTDTLFFRDGRPMSGSLAGHGAAWPLPTVINAALHAALHRAEMDDVHAHKRGRSSDRSPGAERDRVFGSLTTAGPFPVDDKRRWFFPAPADAGKADSTAVTLCPVAIPGASSLPAPLTMVAANREGPTKNKPAPWWSLEAWQAYLRGTGPAGKDPFKNDADFCDTEHNIGIGISAETGTQDGEQIYSAHSLRLREGWSLGTLAEAMDKVNGDAANKRDLIPILFPDSGPRTPVIVGGQQRLCTAERHRTGDLPLPVGPTLSGLNIKWVLLTPAIFPAITADPARGIKSHPGGWLPNWIDPETGAVLLKTGDTLRRPGENREAWRKRVRDEGQPIPAKLVAALTGKPLTVTGYALANPADSQRSEGGAKATYLAVPAGAVYYFKADSPEAARDLAAALNWHGSGDPTTIRNRRSTLMGEKGFGLGLCASW